MEWLFSIFSIHTKRDKYYKRFKDAIPSVLAERRGSFRFFSFRIVSGFSFGGFPFRSVGSDSDESVERIFRFPGRTESEKKELFNLFEERERGRRERVRRERERERETERDRNTDRHENELIIT
jgi:hypothetical protein